MSAVGTEKSPQAFRTITEASEELDVPAHVLRFWEGKFSQLRPLKRAGGRRLYRVDDMALLRGIRALLQDDGYQLKGVQKLLKDQGVAWVRERGGGGLGDSYPFRDNTSDTTDPHAFDTSTDTISAMTPPKQTASAFAAASAPSETLAPAIAPETVDVLRKALSKLEKARALLDQASGQAAR